MNALTICCYEHKGLLDMPNRPYGSIRRYGSSDVVRVDDDVLLLPNGCWLKWQPFGGGRKIC